MTRILEDKVAIVTGAGRGIGRGVAKLLASEGAKVVVVDPGVNMDGSGASKSQADQVVTEIASDGGTSISCYESVASMEGGERIVKTALDRFGQLDIVVTCAGILRDRMIFNMSEKDWDDVIAVHLKGTFSVVKYACIQFRQQRSGRIVTFSSESGLVGNPGQANYGAAKSGISGFTKVVAKDMGRYGVTANCVVPRAATRMVADVPESGIGGVAALGAADLQHDPDDVAPFVGFLASDFASDVNGQFFLVYGGQVSLMSQPRPERSIYHDGGWNLEELAPVARDYLTKGLYNPAMPQAPRQ